MGLGWGLRSKRDRVFSEIRILWHNSMLRPWLYHLKTPERLGTIYSKPSDMCVPDKVMLYALIRGLRPCRVLEIGVRWGTGAKIIAAALEDAGGNGRAIGIDPDPQTFRATQRDLFGRYELLCGYSPKAIPDAAARLGGQLDFVIIDAMHTYDHVQKDLKGTLPHVAVGGHILLHDAYHVGIDQAVAEVLAENQDCVDCGFLSRHAEVTDAPVAYQGLRLIRSGTPDSHEIISAAYKTAGRSEPSLSAKFKNWDYYWNRAKDAPDVHSIDD
jgi:predicted O-methyltransferase YrrM